MMTMVSISQYTSSPYGSISRKSRIIIHDGPMYEIGCVHDERELQELLYFLGAKMHKLDERHDGDIGDVVFYQLDKSIKDDSSGGFMSLEELEKKTDGRTLKKVKGLSNGSIVDCYVEILHDIVNIYRPNPNAKEVYKPMDFDTEMEYRINHWYL